MMISFGGILLEADFIRISERFIKERKAIEERKKNLTDQLQNLQGQEHIKDKNDENKLDKLINEFLELKEINKSYLFRIIDKIEIDKDKKVFISFNFAPLNTICDSIDEFIEIEQILQEKTNTLEQNVG